MKKNRLRVVHIDDLPLGGFAGIVEKQMVLSSQLMPGALDRKDISHGFGDFVYLSTGYFKPNDGAPLHPHENVDIVTVVLSGNLAHAGTLGDGSVIHAPAVQVQRAGTGMRHSEINPDDSKADFVQIWFIPPEQGLAPDYQNISLEGGRLTTVLGGDCAECFDNKMTCKVGNIPANNSLECNQQFIALITEGNATANGFSVSKGDLLEGDSLHIEAISKLGMVLIH
ncbi:Pirin-like protein [Candidatus Thiomargarita nelsonii]|uniref:Pirin-like protein n=1 Tax=Candidatus Thiomargarita nelsonii TaxID=1003181 RepID=A0A0A6PE05_9GAMM|nr:Pirin-like protein [Candidatus Thiomargarita nelsonii]